MAVTSRVYLDHAATTPMLPAAVEAMTEELTRVGNPSSLHTSGRGVRRVVEESRELIASCVNARPSEVVFTSGGTEADNLALKGAFWEARRRDPARTGLLATTIEHHAVLDTLDWLAAAEGAVVTLIPVNAWGRAELEALEERIRDTSAMVSVMWANNEVGTVQPVPQMAEIARGRGALSHSDAVQAVGHLPVSFADSGLDTLTFTAHKLGGPVGVGALLVRREVSLTSLQHGGGQEREIRSGTLDAAAAAGFAAAVSVAEATRVEEEQRIRALRQQLVAGLLRIAPDAVLNGALDPDLSLPGVTNVALPGCEAESLLLLLDAAGFDCSAGSACAAGVSRPSHVLTAMGLPDDLARSCVRFSLGHSSTEADVAALLSALPEALHRARLAGALTG